MNIRNNKGFILGAIYMIFLILSLLSAGYLTEVIVFSNLTRIKCSNIKAFYIAEGGIDYALNEIRNGVVNDSNTNNIQGIGIYNCDWEYKEGYTNRWIINSTGTVNRSRISIQVEAIKRVIPTNFYDYAIYNAKDLQIGVAPNLGFKLNIQGDVIYAQDIGGNQGKITGEITQDPTIKPLVKLDFAQLRTISQAQGNVYNEYRLVTEDLPSSFWYDESEGIPNIVYIETDLDIISWDFGTIGGFIVVAGNVLTDPDATGDINILGKGYIDGCIYSTGDVKLGGRYFTTEGIVMNGGIWSNGDVELYGQIDLLYKEEFMNVISNQFLDTDLQVISWKRIF